MHNRNERVVRLSKKVNLIPVCPECLGGLEIPRVPSEIVGGDGNAVLDGSARVMSKTGEDITRHFLKGAGKTLEIANVQGIKEAILKQRSPSCGSGQIYDGTFSGKIKQGDGVTAALLKRNGIKVVSEEEL